MKIKICGITNPADADLALSEGADLLGFIFCKSPRSIDVRTAREIVRHLPDTRPGVGVFMDQPLADVRAILQETGLTMAQLHGRETAEYAHALGVPVIKTFTAFSAESLEALRKYDSWAYLLDVPKGVGARTKIDSEWAVCAKKFGRVFASGRLTAENVHEAIHRIRPYGVDCASGTERAPGRKDPGRLRAFIQATRTADAETQSVKVEVR